MDKYGILLIENQILQYREIRTNLVQYFRIYPDDCDFIKIADLARISLTKRYDRAIQNPGERRENAIRQLVDYINSKEIEVILMDHVLVGHHFGENGIHLARKLVNNGIKQPIIFLSRTERKNKKVVEDLEKEKITNLTWVEKGYAGQGIGDDWYFRTNVVNEIQKCIDQSINSMLDKIVVSGKFDDLIEEINKLRTKTFMKQQSKELCDFCSNNLALMSHNRLKELIKKWNYE